MLRAGEIIGDTYVIEKKLATGSMSRVYLAYDLSGTTRWVIKEAEIAGDDADVAFTALCTEIEALKTLEHPGLVRIVDALREGNRLLMVTEYVEGMTLERILRTKGPMEEETAARIGVQIADVIGYLHSRSDMLVYRDLKPSNIILRPDGRAVLIDFGCLHTASGGMRQSYVPFGTKGYAAPEQYGMRAALIGEETDIYALGKTLCALLSGGATSVRRLRGISRRMRHIITKCTMPEKERRYRHIAEVYYDLRNQREKTLESRMEDIARILFFLMFAVSGLLSLWRMVTGAEYALFQAAGLLLLSAAVFFFLHIPDAILRLTGLKSRLEVGRRMQSARRNGVFNIGKDMGTKEAVSWQDVEIPLDEPMTDVRIDLDRAKVHFVVMEGFVLERDVMVSCRENYSVVA
ncbi:MAG: serine/threonine protein kinase [Lachnospiraceae bacterium]|nr:serine/threonine protein kinase [Lachnospiraceae bacterium]